MFDIQNLPGLAWLVIGYAALSVYVLIWLLKSDKDYE